jgi:predicted Zn-dependent protease with MMP-like domain
MSSTPTSPQPSVRTPDFTTPPDLDEIERLARAAFMTIPESLRQHTADVVFVVADFPDDEISTAMALDSPFDLLGLYSGVDLTRKSVLDQPGDMDRIYLFRRPLLDYWCETGENLYDIILHVLIHEIGHHFGHSDDEMAQIEEKD